MPTLSCKHAVFELNMAYLLRTTQTNLIVFDLVVANLNQHW